MEPHLRTGRVGEEIACRYLEELGYIIRERNWRFRHREVDIIAQEGNELVFVEVKTRTSSPWGTAMGAVNERKRQHIISAANCFVQLYRLELSVRYDIIAIEIAPDKSYTIEHAKRAYHPTLRHSSSERKRKSARR